ncbi:MAG: hypothetical protein EPO51_00695 [Phenylobacterium sp.]|uniref:DUF6134 family protein n=1 Tax=Phenylobacterium sp. TaxID=1871053 RepID=UPI0011F84EC6|nr:DUF6134 family protein [Phenylobacterium sp.]TAJ74607.1 MAG: hypothetical protein EPO51_00695 [Phenylobacterium sp.]
MSLVIGRRELMAAGIGLLVPGTAFAAPARLAFQVFRNGTRVGEHQMSFAGDEDNRTVTTNVDMVVKIGPVPVYKYKHDAIERWAGGKWVSIDATTNGNGKIQKTSARAMPGYVQITGPKGAVRGPADAVPLSHWNQASFGKPLFNQQEAKMLKVTCAKVKSGHWQVRGEAEIDDFYDASGNWLALQGKLEDGSKMEYRRV